MVSAPSMSWFAARETHSRGAPSAFRGTAWHRWLTWFQLWLRPVGNRSRALQFWPDVTKACFLIECASVLMRVQGNDPATTTLRLLNCGLHKHHTRACPACSVVNNEFFHARVNTPVADGRLVRGGDDAENFPVDFKNDHAAPLSCQEVTVNGARQTRLFDWTSRNQLPFHQFGQQRENLSTRRPRYRSEPRYYSFRTPPSVFGVTSRRSHCGQYPKYGAGAPFSMCRPPLPRRVATTSRDTKFRDDDRATQR
jgi:hypothetical protein